MELIRTLRILPAVDDTKLEVSVRRRSETYLLQLSISEPAYVGVNHAMTTVALTGITADWQNCASVSRGELGRSLRLYHPLIRCELVLSLLHNTMPYVAFVCPTVASQHVRVFSGPLGYCIDWAQIQAMLKARLYAILDEMPTPGARAVIHQPRLLECTHGEAT